MTLREASLPVLLLALLLLAGCGSDDPVDPDTEPEAYPWPDTREQLMDNFQRAYDEMDLEEYGHCLHEDFRFVFTNDEVWSRTEDVASTTNMFAGHPGVDDYGNLKDGVHSITVQIFDLDGDWSTLDPTHPRFPGADQALFAVQIVFFLGSGENTITISSGQLFHTAAEEVDAGGGATRTRWGLVGQRDLMALKTSSDSRSWGDVKRLYD